METVKIAFKHFPLRSHKEAQPAALAAIAAQKQGKFWEFHDLIFQNMRQLSQEKFTEIATTVGLDMERFKKDMASQETAARIQKDLLDGNQVGVRGTPAIYINGRVLKDRSVNGIQKIINEELAKQGKK